MKVTVTLGDFDSTDSDNSIDPDVVEVGSVPKELTGDVSRRAV